MDIPKHALILGGGLEARALGRLLELLGTTGHQHGLTELAESTGIGGGDGQLSDHLRGSRLAIALAGVNTRLNVFVNVVHRLRGRSLWHGAFIAVVKRNEDMDALANLDLFGDRLRRFRFAREMGHAVIARPVFYAEVVKVISAIREVGPNAWSNRLKETNALQLLDDLKHAEFFIINGESDLAVEAARRILTGVAERDWFPLLKDSHRDAELAPEFLASHPPERVMTLRDVSAVLVGARRLLAKTVLGDHL